MNIMTEEKHYNTLSNYYKHTFGKKVFKVALNADFTCPNKDGKAGYGGCTFCSASGSGDFAGEKSLPLKMQFDEVRGKMHEKWPDAYYIPYFQANTNTYAPLHVLKPLFEEAVTLDPHVVMLSIATRPDCLEPDVLDYLEELNTRIPIQVEMGLQTIHESSAVRINRGHNLKCFDDAVYELRKRNIEVVVHIINGLPYETEEMMLATLKHINALDIQGIKIHLLHIMKLTKMGKEFLKNPFPLLSLEDYVDIVVKQLGLLRKDIIVHRITGDAPKELLIAPMWSLKKFVIMNEIDKRMRQLNLYQGDYYGL